MVRLNKIMTRTGDDGSTGLADGSRARKDDPRIEACGSVDELSAQLGFCLTVLGGHALGPEAAMRLRTLLSAVQQDLFDLGAILASPQAGGAGLVPIDARHVEALEDALASMNAELEPLKSFVLPGGHPVAAGLHIARTKCRRAERRCVGLDGVAEPDRQVLPYLNRLGDLLFVAARWANAKAGREEPLWTPGGGTVRTP